MKDTLRRMAGQQIMQLRVFHGDDAREDEDQEPDGQNQDKLNEVEAFWAGRNHAMRRSARVAA